MNKERLLRLADHLEHGKLGHDTFAFEVFSHGERKANGCGTAGCAIGECVVVFPESWFIHKAGTQYMPLLRETDVTWLDVAESLFDAAEFFDLDYNEAELLFIPCQPKVTRFGGGEELPHDATPAQVAANIRAFVSWKEAR